MIAVAVYLLLPLVARRFMRDGFYEFQAPSWTALSYLSDLQEYWSLRSRSKNELIQAGRDLARQNSAYIISVQENATLRAELTRLEQLLGLPREPGFDYSVARVMDRDYNAWWQQAMIRQGGRHGLKPGQAVIFAGGVAGRVTEVHTYTAVVELVTSPAYRMAAHLEGDLRPVIFQGGYSTALTSPYGRVSNVPLDIKASADKPLRVVSSRLGGVFPDGLTIGYVSTLETGPDGLFQAGDVRLDERLLSLQEVSVLIPLEGNAP
ncbi:MAG: rod shape-determining protein MreC [Verrucomicrobiota bacterium]|nr:rod shape-determining protein MreC [Verrucomicrobiota bacterium]